MPAQSYTLPPREIWTLVQVTIGGTMPFLKVLAIACLLAGAGLYLAVLEKNSLSCNRDAGTCTLRQAGVFKTTVTSFSVSVPLLFAAAFWWMAVLAGKLAPRAAPRSEGD
jgi:hypothetical protein